MNAAANVTAPILRVDHLSMKFGGLVAIGDLSFEARRGEITALIGPNGAGKTTVFNCITGFYKPTEGMLTMTRRDGSQYLLERLPNHEIPARAKVARTFQNIRLFSGMTLLENLLVAQHNKLMKASGYTILGLLGVGGYKAAAKESVEIAKHWLEKADLIDRADDPAGDLPYGAQRRLEIARAMCTGPELLCLDEPAAGLNPRESLALNALLNDIRDNTGTSILLIEHDMSVVMQISDHVVVLEYGRKISDGDPTHVKSDPRVIAAYLGVDDEEVVDVLTEVGDEQVIETLDAEPDRAHGPGDSSSMMAGSIGDTVAHSDEMGERITVARGASKAEQVDRLEAAHAKPASLADIPGKPTSSAKKPPAKPSVTGSTSVKSPVKGPAKPAASRASAAAPVKSTGTSAKAPDKSPAKMAVAPATRLKKAEAKPAARAPAKAAAPAAARPAAKPAAAKPATAALPADDILAIKGIGPVNKKKLNEHGIHRFDQIAAWKKADIIAVEKYLEFDGRIEREDWIGQAKQLAKAAAAAAKRGGKN
jgi:branched-chain amino acid transport system ATP-binding protein